MGANLFSFDVVSRVDLSEFENALNQARKEIDTRFDFKGTNSRIERAKDSTTLYSSDDFHIRAMAEVLTTWLVRRKVPLESVVWGPILPGPKGSVKQEISVKQGIDPDTAREITKFIKKLNKKVNVSFQQDHLRVSSKSKDELQAVISALREKKFGLALQFVNFRP